MKVKTMVVNGVLVALLVCAFPPRTFAQSAPDCDEAFSTCKSTCENKTISNGNGPLVIQPSDFKTKCKNACLAGFNSCQTQDSVHSCKTFTNHCTSDCPWTVSISAMGFAVPTEYTDSFKQCRASCNMGNKSCGDRIKKGMPPRKRSGKFNACVEAQFACYSSCSTLPGDEIDACSEACARGVEACNPAPAAAKCAAYKKECQRNCPALDETGEEAEEREYEGVGYCEDSCAWGQEHCEEILR
jgi:hypothetical protein